MGIPLRAARLPGSPAPGHLAPVRAVLAPLEAFLRGFPTPNFLKCPEVLGFWWGGSGLAVWVGVGEHFGDVR